MHVNTTACRNLVVVLSLAVHLGAPVSAFAGARVAQEKADKVEDDYRIGKGDVVSVSVINHGEYSITGQVLPDGTLVFPVLGKIKMLGRTREDIADEVAKGLIKKKLLNRPMVTVNIIQREQKEITLLGVVRSPGKLSLKDNWTILDALGASGGIGLAGVPSDRYEFYNAELFREAQVISLNLAKIYANDPAHNLPLMNGDKIYVTAKDRNLITVTVIGQVGTSNGGTVELPKDRSLLTLLNDMGGVTDKAALSKATLLRKGKVLNVDLRGYKKGKIETDILLEGGDILTIPKIESKYKINGAVSTKGEIDYPDDRELTLFDALTIAGIPPTGADLTKVKLTRSEKGVSTTQEVNVEKMLKGNRTSDMKILPDDEIYVPATDPNRRRWGSTQDYLSLLTVLPGLYFILRGR